MVLSVDEKSQVQALDRTQPGLPMKKGRVGTMTHDWRREMDGAAPPTRCWIAAKADAGGLGQNDLSSLSSPLGPSAPKLAGEFVHPPGPPILATGRCARRP